MAEIFKSYDVRGIYPNEINEEIVERIGSATVRYLKAKRIAVGSDNRVSSPALSAALMSGITRAGCEVVSLGLISTPMLYFASTKLDVDAAIMLTASHNPPEYNGLKICKRNAVPMGLASGLSEIRDIAFAHTSEGEEKRSAIHKADIGKEYIDFVSSFADLGGKSFRVAIDTAHAMGVLELPIVRSVSGLSIARVLYDGLEPPGTCPHEANPIKAETLRELAEEVRSSHLDMGIAYDGDADRIGFVDERGEHVPMDLVTALLAQALLPTYPNSTILYDLRSSRAVKETIESLGGIARECKVGHANIKKQMIEEKALLAGEASGHYYFSLGGYTAEIGTLPAILLLNLMARTGKRLSELVNDVCKYHHSGEINLHADRIPERIALVRAHYHDGTLSELDGVKITYPDWWFSLRASNTEPLLRLNLEANTQALMESKKAELLNLLTN